jgi:hypothetical protein
VAVHHNDTEVLLARQETLANAKSVIVRLTAQRHAWSDACMHKQIVAIAMIDRERLKKFHVFNWNPPTPIATRPASFNAPAIQGCLAADVQPISRRRAIT